jgi:hypothetical protein
MFRFLPLNNPAATIRCGGGSKGLRRACSQALLLSRRTHSPLPTASRLSDFSEEMIVPAGGAWLGPHPPKLLWRSTVAQRLVSPWQHFIGRSRIEVPHPFHSPIKLVRFCRAVWRLTTPASCQPEKPLRGSAASRRNRAVSPSACAS